MPLHLEVVTPKGPVLTADADAVFLPGKLGEFGVLDGHVPFLSALRPGVLRYTISREEHRLAVGTGFVEVGAASKVLVLTDMHALPEEVDVDETAQELAAVEARLKAWTGELDIEHQELRQEAAWAQARLDLRKPSARP